MTFLVLSSFPTVDIMEFAVRVIRCVCTEYFDTVSRECIMAIRIMKIKTNNETRMNILSKLHGFLHRYKVLEMYLYVIELFFYVPTGRVTLRKV